ncbi:MAG TPA: hypothetical protein VGB59_01600 [Allosphingosinicella sp.]|jgi:hypothetical protein
MNLALISGIAGILGLLLQLTDSFPEHREVRRAVVLMILGFFAGTLAAASTGARITIHGGMAPSYLLIAALLAVTLILLISAIFVTADSRRAELYLASAICGGAMLAVFFLVSVAWALSGTGPNSFTIEEYLALSKSSEGRGDFARAIEMTERAEANMPPEDPRREQLQGRISRLEAAQIQHPSR